MTTPNGAIKFNATSGSDTAASGLGPATALTGSGASTDGTAVVTGISTTGASAGDLLWVQTASGRQFSIIASVDSSTQVTCDDTFALGTGQTWAIGGKRATFDNADSRVLLSSDAKVDFVVETETDQTITSTIPLALLTIAGTSTGYGDRKVVACSASNTYSFSGGGNTVRFRNIKFTNTNATKTSGAGWLQNTTGTTIFHNCEFGDATDYLYNGTQRSSGSSNMHFYDCYSHDNVNYGLSTGGGGSMTFVNTVVENCGGIGVYTGNGLSQFFSSVVANCSGSYLVYAGGGFESVDSIYHTGTNGVSALYMRAVSKSVFYGMSTALASRSGSSVSSIQDNYFGSVTTNTSLAGSEQSFNEIALTADPCVDAAGGDYNLNETSGGGADLRALSQDYGATAIRPFRWLDAAAAGVAAVFSYVANFTRLG